VRIVGCRCWRGDRRHPRRSSSLTRNAAPCRAPLRFHRTDLWSVPTDAAERSTTKTQRGRTQDPPVRMQDEAGKARGLRSRGAVTSMELAGLGTNISMEAVGLRGPAPGPKTRRLSATGERARRWNEKVVKVQERRNEMEFTMGPRQHTYLASKRGRHWRIVVGWDNPLETFYAQVWEQYVDERPGHEEREELELWLGLERREIGDLEELEELVEP
jgi:hypothetical protein